MEVGRLYSPVLVLMTHGGEDKNRMSVYLKIENKLRKGIKIKGVCMM